jgi:hypothetical protein
LIVATITFPVGVVIGLGVGLGLGVGGVGVALGLVPAPGPGATGLGLGSTIIGVGVGTGTGTFAGFLTSTLGTGVGFVGTGLGPVVVIQLSLVGRNRPRSSDFWHRRRHRCGWDREWGFDDHEIFISSTEIIFRAVLISKA